MSYHIQLERFEGPLGLLLHLIRKEEMDIFDINIQEITTQYMAYIKAMKQLDLEVAGEFIAMAATLIHIKSRMLLPQYNEDGEVIEDEDPRKDLVNKLLEYQKYQEISQELYERPLLGRDIWLKGRRETIDVEDDGEVIVEEDNALFALISSYRKAIRNLTKSVHKVGVELQSIAARILEIKEALIIGVRMRFRDLITQSDSKRDQVLVTFLSLLELAKMGFISLFQADSYSEIHVEAKKAIDRDVIARVESYEGDQASEIADELMFEAEGHDQESIMERTDIEVHTHAPEQGILPLTEGDDVEENAFFVQAASDEEIEAEERRIEQSERESHEYGSHEHGPLERDLSEDDSSERDLSEQGSFEQGSSEWDLSERDSSERDSSERDSSERDPEASL